MGAVCWHNEIPMGMSPALRSLFMGIRLAPVRNSLALPPGHGRSSIRIALLSGDRQKRQGGFHSRSGILRQEGR